MKKKMAETIREETGGLKRYNEIMFASISTILVLFVAGAVLIGLAAGLSGKIQTKDKTGIKMNEETGAKKEKESFEFYNPIIIERSNYIMLPLGIKQKSAITGGFSSVSAGRRGAFSYSAASNQNYSNATGRYRNIMFYNNATGASHLLLDKKGIISSIYYPSNKKENYVKFLMFAISDKDTNGDGYITGDDETIVYMSDLSGKNLTQITPANTQFLDWNMDEKGTYILISIVKDTNKDHKFDDKDDTAIIKVNPLKPGIGVEITTDEVLKKLEVMK
jgi:hypothetical protein